MPVPMICRDERLGQFAAAFRGCFSKPQARYFEIVLLALLLCQERHTLSGLRRQIAEPLSVAGLSRFLSTAPWSAAAVIALWTARFAAQMAPRVADEQRQRAERPTRRGCCRPVGVRGDVSCRAPVLPWAPPHSSPGWRSMPTSRCALPLYPL